MVARVGRQVSVSAGGTPIASCRTKTVSINNEPVDITTDDDNGYRALLAAVNAQSSIDIQVEGILKSSTLLDGAISGGAALDVELVVDFGDTVFSGPFKQVSMEIGAPYNDGVTFTAQYQSSGAFGLGS